MINFIYLTSFCSQLIHDLSQCIAVGDGVHDIQMFNTEGYSIAINPAKPLINETGDVVVKDKDFNKVVNIILGRIENN